MLSVADVIRDRIGREGPITFMSFMKSALYHPGLGYYASESAEIGKGGDFYTSPHLHPAFGAMVGRQLEEMWEALGRPEVFDAVEVGAGRGYLCKDVLDYLKGGELFGSLRYWIVEMNPHMARRQTELLGGFTDKVRWSESLSEIRPPIRGCVLSNELLDAFPVHLIEQGEELMEVYVGLEGERFVEVPGPPSTDEIAAYLKEFSIDLPGGYRTEVNLGIKDWLRDVSGMLGEGFVLTVDYGYPAREYYAPERDRGTLLCYYRHRLGEDPYVNAGEQDITAHVNFSSVRKWGGELDLRCLGFCRQGAYLVSLGIDELITELYAGSETYLDEVSKIKGLIMPGTMGDTHKVMIQYKADGEPPALRGFLMKNQARDLL